MKKNLYFFLKFVISIVLKLLNFVYYATASLFGLGLYMHISGKLVDSRYIKIGILCLIILIVYLAIYGLQEFLNEIDISGNKIDIRPNNNNDNLNPNKKDESELVMNFVNELLAYCQEKGLNPSMSVDGDLNANIVNYDSKTDTSTVITDLTVPDSLTEKNYKFNLEHMKDVIDKFATSQKETVGKNKNMENSEVNK